MSRADTLKQANERQRGYAVERRLDDTQPERARPRLGGSSLLPASGAGAELFLVSLEDLAIEERAAAGWCVRFGVAEPPTDGEYDLHELVVELTIMVGGTAHTVEVNAFPGCTVHLVGEQIAARMKWGINPVTVPPLAELRWQLTRGTCQTTGVRSFTVQGVAEGVVPAFATSFALFSGDADVTEELALNFVTHAGATRVQQHYTRDDLLQCIGEFTALPPGANLWRWLEPADEPLRLVFGFEQVRR